MTPWFLNSFGLFILYAGIDGDIKRVATVACKLRFVAALAACRDYRALLCAERLHLNIDYRALSILDVSNNKLGPKGAKALEQAM